MSSELMAVSDGTFILAESKEPKVFYFYRNDREIIGEVDNLPMDFYRKYIRAKMIDGQNTEIVMNDICLETSNDGKYIRLTVSEIGENRTNQKQPNFIKRFLSKIFK